MSFMWLFWLGLEVVFSACTQSTAADHQAVRSVHSVCEQGISIFWSTLWALLIFREKVTPANTIGVIVIFAGIMLVNQDAK